MEVDSIENTEISTFSSSDADRQLENLRPHLLNHGDVEPKRDIKEEVKSILEVIAATGQYWHDWDVLKNLLSFHLKQVLAEYPESKIDSDATPQPNSSMVESYPELVKRLDEALLSFTDGPPFTLQRLCEILLTPHSIYPNLSKLALALEKNLLVTSTLTISAKPSPMPKPAGFGEGSVDPITHFSKPTQNGIEASLAEANEDEEMAEAETNGNKNTGIAAEEKISETSEADANSDSEPSAEPESEPSTEPETEPSSIPKPSDELNSTSS